MLGAIFLLLASSTIAWTLSDKTPPAWDPSDHISAAYDYYRPVAHLDFRAFARELFVEPHYYAPFVHLVSAIIFLVFGASKLTGILVNLISLAVLLASVSWTSRTLYGQGNTGVIAGVMAALLASCYHFSAWLMHDAFLDFPLIAVVAAAFALLIRARDFRDRRAAVIFAAVAGVGLLTKQTFAFFFLLPGAYVLLKAAFARDLRALLNLAIAAAIIAAIASVWYVPHLEEVLSIYRVNQEAAGSENEAPLFTFASNAFYLHALVSGQMQMPFGLLFLSGLIYSLIYRRKQSVMLYLWLASGIGMFTLIANKDVRYTVPVLPAAALISVCWLSDARLLSRLKRSKTPSDAPQVSLRERATVGLKLALAAAMASWALVSFFNAQWPQPGAGFYVDTPRFRWMVFARNYYGFDHRPLSDEWSVPDIVRSVAALAPASRPTAQVLARNRPGENPGENPDENNEARSPDPRQSVSPQTFEAGEPEGTPRPILGVVVNLPHLNPSSLALYARLMARERAGPPVINVDWLVVDSARDRIEGCDYLLVRTGLEHAEWVAPIERHVEQLIRSHPERFTRVAAFPLPLKQAEAVIYRCGG
jgi:4-amino-4-deoxy-L-arabinose transferase-like glycosyltransferase